MLQWQRRGDPRAAPRRAIDPHVSSQRGDAISQAPQSASFRPGAPHSIVAHLDVQVVADWNAFVSAEPFWAQEQKGAV